MLGSSYGHQAFPKKGFLFIFKCELFRQCPMVSNDLEQIGMIFLKECVLTFDFMCLNF